MISQTVILSVKCSTDVFCEKTKPLPTNSSFSLLYMILHNATNYVGLLNCIVSHAWNKNLDPAM